MSIPPIRRGERAPPSHSMSGLDECDRWVLSPQMPAKGPIDAGSRGIGKKVLKRQARMS